MFRFYCCFFYIVDTNHLSYEQLAKAFDILWAVYLLMSQSFAIQKLFHFMKSNLLIAVHMPCATGVLFRKCLPVPLKYAVLAVGEGYRMT